jgi:hypothetical protein
MKRSRFRAASSPASCGSHKIPLSPHTVGKRRSALMDAVLEEVGQRVDMRCIHVGVGGEIRRRVEADGRVASCQPNMLQWSSRLTPAAFKSVQVLRYPLVSNSAFGLRPSFQPTVWRCWSRSTCAAATSGRHRSAPPLAAAARSSLFWGPAGRLRCAGSPAAGAGWTQPGTLALRKRQLSLYRLLGSGVEEIRTAAAKKVKL